MADFILTVQTDRVGSKVTREFEVPDEELAECEDEQARNAVIDDYAREVLFECIEWGWKEDSSNA